MTGSWARWAATLSLLLLALACDELYVAGAPLCLDTEDCPRGYVCARGECVRASRLPPDTERGDFWPPPDAVATDRDAAAPHDAGTPEEADAPGGCDPAACGAEAPPGPCWRMRCDPATGTCRAAPLPDGDICGPFDDPCHAPRCRQALCAPMAASDGTPCDTVFPCTLGDRCEAGACVPGPVPACDDGDPCTTDDCDALTGACAHAPLPHGSACDDGDPCAVDGRCTEDGCVAQPKICDDGDPCTFSRCDPTTGRCRNDPLPDDTACDDGDPCTERGRCRAGECRAVPIDCDDGDPCTTNDCDPREGGCVTHPIPDCPR